MKRYLTTLFAALCVAAVAYAQPEAPKDGAGGPPPGEKKPHGPMSADANNDGKVTFEEMTTKVPAMSRERFNELDRNKDGVLTKEDRPPRPEGGGHDGPGGSGGPGGGMGRRLHEADTDGDGKVSLAEAQKAMPEMTPEHFKEMDANSDGFLTPEDRPRPPDGGPDGPGGPGGRGGERGKRFREADTDGDGKLSLAEAQKAFPDMTPEKFKERDHNGDGFLSREDRPEGGPDGPGGPGRGPGGRLREADTNGDHKISLEEAQKAIPDMTKERFDRMDRNKDGFITPEDRPQGPPPGDQPAPPPAPAGAPTPPAPAAK